MLIIKVYSYVMVYNFIILVLLMYGSYGSCYSCHNNGLSSKVWDLVATAGSLLTIVFISRLVIMRLFLIDRCGLSQD